MKGCYCLVIAAENNKRLKIGKKLKIDFKKGTYVYVGSAMNNLESRVKDIYPNQKSFTGTSITY